MTINLELTEYDPSIFNSEDGQKPFQFQLTIPPAATEITRAAADSIRRQLLDLIPGNNHEIAISDIAFDGDEPVAITSTMLFVKIEYLDAQPRFLHFTLSTDGEDLVLH